MVLGVDTSQVPHAGVLLGLEGGTVKFAAGDLNGQYGYSSSTFGMGVGEYSTDDYITIDSINGIRFLNSADTTILQMTSGLFYLSGEIRVGDAGTPGVDFSGIRIYKSGATYRVEGQNSGTIESYMGADGKIYSGGGEVVIAADGITLDAGLAANNRVKWDDGTNLVAYIDADGVGSGMQFWARNYNAGEVPTSTKFEWNAIEWNAADSSYMGLFSDGGLRANSCTGGYHRFAGKAAAAGDIRLYGVTTCWDVAGGNCPLRVSKSGTAATPNLQEWGNNAATYGGGTVLMEVEGTGVIDFRWGMGNSSKDPTTDAPVDWVEVKIGGTVRYLPAYAA